MGGGEENREREHFPVQANGAGRDLFFFGNHFTRKLENRSCDGEEDEDIELSLGLSMNGRFGVDPKRSHEKLTRSSSISNFIVNRDDNNARSASGAVAYAPLTRTCSLPAETEEEWRKRKELQTLRRMEAKRKRMEKLKNVRVVTDKAYFEDNLEENGQGLVPTDKNGFLQVPAPQLSPQGSVGSLGSGSSGIYDFENQPLQGVNKDTQMIIPNPVKTLAVKLGQNPETQPVTKNGKPDNSSGAVFENSSMKVTVADHEGKEMLRNVLVDMPCVSTKGKGSHGKKIDGFLYRYRKEEEVKIVCVCHGSFLSPAEFVKHAGGGDVAHPLRHIVVNPSPFCNGGEPLC